MRSSCCPSDIRVWRIMSCRASASPNIVFESVEVSRWQEKPCTINSEFLPGCPVLVVATIPRQGSVAYHQHHGGGQALFINAICLRHLFDLLDEGERLSVDGEVEPPSADDLDGRSRVGRCRESFVRPADRGGNLHGFRDIVSCWRCGGVGCRWPSVVRPLCCHRHMQGDGVRQWVRGYFLVNRYPVSPDYRV
uniref:Uncharacterized protein n=1 Tax=Glossina pallidipes TaxID=7398 RepID=A0A1B0AAH3_GLOPL